MAENSQFILALDQGTTSTRAILVDHNGRVAAEAQTALPQILPQPGWVEHDPLEVWRGAAQVMAKVADGRWEQVRGIGITNQRETVILWEKATGKPVGNAIVWQDRRTATRCAELAPQADMIADRTGLVIDPYFSASKLQWMLRNNAGARGMAEDGQLCFGTVDSWLAWKLSGGRAHVTDFTNASRTMLFDIHRRVWDDELLRMFNVPTAVLPQVRGPCEVVATTDPALTGGRQVPIAGIAGDQQAALFGQKAWAKGEAKNTYGTGAFLLMNVGGERVRSANRLLVTLAADERGRAVYALEGSIFVAGAAIQWLRDQLGIIGSSDECQAMASSIPDNGGVYFVPAFVGLGAPYWRSDVRGAIFGLTRGTGKAHLVRAALEAIAYQTRQVIDAMRQDSGVALAELASDGGASRNDWLMQFQADVLGVPVVRAANVEMTAIGAAYFAGMAVGFWDGPEEIRALAAAEGRRFVPQRKADDDYATWRRRVEVLLKG